MICQVEEQELEKQTVRPRLVPEEVVQSKVETGEDPVELDWRWVTTFDLGLAAFSSILSGHLHRVHGSSNQTSPTSQQQQQQQHQQQQQRQQLQEPQQELRQRSDSTHHLEGKTVCTELAGHGLEQATLICILGHGHRRETFACKHRASKRTLRRSLLLFCSSLTL